MCKNMKKIVIGLPSYNEERNIAFVTRQVDLGLRKFFNPNNCLIVNLDSKSKDKTKNNFLKTKTFCAKRYLDTGKDPRGKGKNLLALFRVSKNLGAQYIATIDSDVTTVKPSWPLLLLRPLIENSCDYVVPVYVRNRFEGNVTNHFAYPLMCAVFKINLRQPIGGEFGISERFYRYLLKQQLNDAVLEYGIDIFMTLHAAGGGFNISEVFLGEKLHGAGFSTLMYKFLQICESAMGVARIYKNKGFKLGNIKRYRKRIGIKKGRIKFPSSKKEVRVQLKHFYHVFLKNEKFYNRYLGSSVTEIKRVMSYGEPKLTASLWIEALTRFLNNTLYNEENGNYLTTSACELIAPIFFWRVISFWHEVENLPHEEAEIRIRDQAKLLKREITLLKY